MVRRPRRGRLQLGMMCGGVKGGEWRVAVGFVIVLVLVLVIYIDSFGLRLLLTSYFLLLNVYT